MAKNRVGITDEQFMKILGNNVPVVANNSSSSKSGDETSDEKKSLYDSITKINEGYGVYESDEEEEPTLKTYDYKAMTDDEIQSYAESIIKGETEAKKKAETDAAALKTQQLSQKKETLSEQADKTASEIEKNYTEAAESVGEQALKRGLGRSSIVLNQLFDLDEEKINKLMENDSGLKNDVTEINSEIDTLEVELNGNLNTLDEEYKSSLTEKIYDLKNERDSKILAALKYNNDVIEKMSESGTSGSKYKYSSYKEELAALSGIAEEVLKYYSTMDPQAAYNDLLKDEVLKEQLGRLYEPILAIEKKRVDKK